MMAKHCEFDELVWPHRYASARDQDIPLKMDAASPEWVVTEIYVLLSVEKIWSSTFLDLIS